MFSKDLGKEIIPLRKLKMFVWDWNGTVLDDTHAVHRATNQHIRTSGGREVTLEEMKETKSVPLESFYVGRGCDPMLLKKTNVFYDAYDSYARYAPLHEHIVTILRILHDRGVRSAVLTNNIREHVDHHLDRHDIRHLFADVSYNHTGNQILYGAIKGQRLPDLINGFQPFEVAVVGDTVEEIEIAHSYGCVSIAISVGVHPGHKLAAAKPTYLFDSYLPFLEAIRD